MCFMAQFNNRIFTEFDVNQMGKIKDHIGIAMWSL